ncbi:MAG: ABC transporter substrate-binding protein [Polyangiaceae bacterium]|nr:ABC transporter substrate-binding protein [Polyangiaceae bacterium]MCE7890178.1 ABC transporter substrate-binding protein [Sorangiineae bacterium PRO1]MCL4754555.1 ABC transporter substrate-binding protein [Myxococcales bacterium]
MRVYVRLLLGALLGVLAACRAPPEDGARLRIAHMARLTHAPALTALDSGRLGRALPDVQIDAQLFEVGNAAIEALFAGDADVALLGPNPAINGFVRSSGEVRIVAGVASGGTAFVVRNDAGINSPSDLRGRRLATPQIASTQDVALRAYLRRHGLVTTLEGGDVMVLPMGSAEIRQLFRRGEIDGAFVSEPLASELVASAGARVLLDERDEWPGRRHPATVLAVRKRYLDAHPGNVRRLVAALDAEARWVEEHRAEALGLCLGGIQRRLGKAPPRGVAEPAFERVSFTTDPMPEALAKLALDAEAEGFLPKGADLTGLVLGAAP